MGNTYKQVTLKLPLHDIPTRPTKDKTPVYGLTISLREETLVSVGELWLHLCPSGDMGGWGKSRILE